MWGKIIWLLNKPRKGKIDDDFLAAIIGVVIIVLFLWGFISCFPS